MKKSVLLPAMMILGSVALTAQETWTEALTEEMTPLQKEMVAEIGTAATDYWNPRLNKYRRTVDRVMSDEDLAALNQMRVRFAILIDRVGETMNRELTDEEPEDGLDFRSEKGEGALELMEIWTQTIALGQKYGEQLAPLGDRVFTDVVRFGDDLAVRFDTFVATHGEELQGDEKGNELLANRTEIVAKLRSVEDVRESFTGVYGFVIEPLIMLFNGGDIRDMIPGVAGSTGTSSAGAVAGLLPASTTLAQNYPNPASGTTTIPLTLDAPITGATLRIFNADGAEVRSIRLDRLTAGDHTVEVDVSTLDQGTYLYQLTLGTGEAEELHAKVMQVVR